MEYFCCVLRRHLIKKFKDVGANALFICLLGFRHLEIFDTLKKISLRVSKLFFRMSKNFNVSIIQ